MEIVKCIILSHKRADNVQTDKIVSNCSICVPKSQADEYRKYNDVEIIEHPDTVLGYAEKVRWIYEKYKNVFMLDDDLTHIQNLCNESYKLTADDVYDLIQNQAEMCKEYGMCFFGFGKENNPISYTGLNPFSFTALVIGGQMGFLDGYPMDAMPKDVIGSTDTVLTGINAHYNRISLVDNRFCFVSKSGTFKSTGGMADVRNIETEKEDLFQLKKMFGDAIKVKTKSGLRMKLQHEYERTLTIPF